MPLKLLIIGLGGFLGSISRYLTQELVKKMFESQVPLGTLIANIAGCFIIGVVYALADKYTSFSNEWKIFLTVGFCGGFTTFSSFAHENFMLLKNNQFTAFFIYTSLSFVLGLLAVLGGIQIIK